MGDFGDLIRETLVGTPGMPDGPSARPDEQRVDALDRRMRTVRTVLWLGGLVCLAIIIAMIVMLIGDDGEDITGTMVLAGSVLVWAVVAIAMLKLWHFQMQSHTELMKEVFRLQAMVEDRTADNTTP